jgi:CelD/BcsL family acetyltransferase involved in cellulose biosynthesis
MRTLWKRIVKALPGFDVANLEKIPDTIGGQPNPLRAVAAEPQAFSGYALRLAGTWAEIARSLPRGQDSRRKRRRLQDVGVVTFRIARSAAEIDQFLEALVRQKRRRYLETRGLDGLARPGYLDYLRQSTLQLSGSGRVQLSALFCGDVIVAAHWGIVAADRFYYLMPSFEAGDWLKFSPGRLIVEDLLEWCAGEHIRLFDFGVGDEPYKTEFSADRIPLWHGLHARTPVGSAYAAIRRGRSRLLASDLGPNLREFRDRWRKASAEGRG